MMNISPFPILMIIPSGIGCSVGGYAGDAIPSARLLAAASGCLITHPNVMNAASLYWNDPRIQYVEGYGIDQLASGKICLRPVRKQKIGLLFDAGLNQDLFERHLQVADACRTSLGLDIGPIVKTEKPLEISLKKGISGASWGHILRPEILISAGEQLRNLGATAIAVVTLFPDDSTSESFHSYRLGEGVDMMAGAEAVISHLLVRHLALPCAHAPALPSLQLAISPDPRAAAEEIGYTFLSSVLVGLSRAPDLLSADQCQLESRAGKFTSALIKPEDIGAIVVPNGALGGDPVLSCLEKKIPVIAVMNSNILNVTEKSLEIEDLIRSNSSDYFLQVNNYLEAAGLVLALREGISPVSLKRPISSLLENLS